MITELWIILLSVQGKIMAVCLIHNNHIIAIIPSTKSLHAKININIQTLKLFLWSTALEIKIVAKNSVQVE